MQENEHSSLKKPSGQENDFSARQDSQMSEFWRMQCRIHFNGKVFSKGIWKELREKLIEDFQNKPENKNVFSLPEVLKQASKIEGWHILQSEVMLYS